MEKAINRQRVLLQHLLPSSSTNPPILSASVCGGEYERNGSFGDDVVIVAAYRTAICKSKRGGFKDTHPEDLLTPVLKALLDKTRLNPSEVGDIIVGTVLAPGSQRAIECRMAAFYAGFPDTVPLRTVNRQCSSGLQAVADVAAAIKAGFYDIGIGAGLESMTVNAVTLQGPFNPRAQMFQQAKDCLLPMGITSENVAQRYGVTRIEQDQAAVESHKRAAAAIAAGKFKEEIIPVNTKIVDPKTGEEKQITVSVDDGIRPDTSVAGLAKLKPAFKKDGCTTAGNASQVSDGAGAVLLMKRSVAVQKGLPILGVFTEICNLIEENHACLERFNDLKEEKAALNEENVSVIFNALKLEHLLIFFENMCAEKTSNLTLLSDDISSLLAVKDGLYEEIKLQNKRMNEMEIEKTTEVAEAQEECAELCRKLEYANRDLDVANMVINELKEKNQFLSSDNASKDEKIMGSTEANGLLVKELETLNCELQVVKRREEYLTSELKKRISEVNESEDEIGRLWSETQYSMLSAAILKERVFELLVACEGLEISAFLQRERCSEEIVSRNAHVDKLKKKLHDLEGERSTLKAELDAYSLLLVSLCDSIASLEEHIFLLTKIQKRQDDESSYTPGNKKSSRTTAKAGFLELQKLIPKVEVLQKMIIDTKTLLKQEKLISPRKDVSKEKYGQITKDIQLDQASRSYKIKNAESDDQMLELWETAAGDDIEAVEEVKSEYPSSELVAEKELSIDKLEVTTRIKESPREWTKRLTEKLDSDARRLSVLQSSLHGLEIKLEHLEKKKLSKNSKYGTQKLQLREAEEDILELVNLNGELKKKVEESFMEKERSHISEEVTGESEKIGKLELEVQNIEYIILKIEEEEENKRVRYVHRKASILLREYIYTRTDGKWKKRRGPFCGCMRPKTKA